MRINYLFMKVLELVITFFGITIISFFILHLAPGKPTDVMTNLNPKVTPEARARLVEEWHLDQPIYVQYGLWFKDLVSLDLGVSMSSDRRPVWDKIKERLPITVLINVLSMLLIFCVAIPIGVYSALHQYSRLDKVLTVTTFIGFAIPAFWLALLLMIFFGVKLGWLPISGLTSVGYESLNWLDKMWDRVSHLILPVFVSSFSGIAGLSRYMRSNMLEVIRQDYIITARAKGLPERTVIYKHALKNAMLPVITILGLSIPALIGGSVIFETVFGIPGMGQLFYMSVMMRDYTVIMGILIIGAGLTLAGNFMADLAYMLVDPRIRITNK